jgi:hypothetical protein
MIPNYSYTYLIGVSSPSVACNLMNSCFSKKSKHSTITLSSPVLLLVTTLIRFYFSASWSNIVNGQRYRPRSTRHASCWRQNTPCCSQRVVLFINSCSISATTNQTARSGNRAGQITTLELQDFFSLFRIRIGSGSGFGIQIQTGSRRAKKVPQK